MTGILERVRKAQKALGYRVVREAGDEIESLRAEIARLRKGIQDYLDGDWDGPHRLARKIDRCPHGRFQWDSCEACTDLHFHNVLDPVSRPEGSEP